MNESSEDYQAKWAAEKEQATAKLIAGLRDAKVGDKYSISFTGYADAHIVVNVTDAMLTKARKGTDDGNTDAHLLSELLENVGYDLIPGICAQCAGWSNDGISLGLGDDWEMNEMRKEEE